MHFSKCHLLVPKKRKMTGKKIIIQQNKVPLMEILDVILVFYFLCFCLLEIFHVYKG